MKQETLLECILALKKANYEAEAISGNTERSEAIKKALEEVEAEYYSVSRADLKEDGQI